MPRTEGLLKSPGDHGEGAATRGAEDKGRAERDDEDSSQRGTADCTTRRQQNAEAGHALGERGLTRFNGSDEMNADVYLLLLSP
ncbi:hypothetical protein NDU88_008993 [Pleurodeles waltl]|uniref:Uncharacterized protein n=1 Tax=Pleurodeles waltl TaxID=8319 RepID=A0AAV7QRM5_PLEWA|nr:hypothetical protein NDU88_008993 [Pleurodeles waltl]